MIHRFTSRYTAEILISLTLSLMILVCYQPVSDYGFINYDDPLYTSANAHVRNGLTVEGFFWAFRDMKSGHWHPLTWLSHMLDWQLFRANAGGHHWTNVIFHIANTLLLFYILRLMTGTLWRSACVAALFAIHPMNVESVAWVAERKNVLSTCFGFLTLLFYAFYIRKPGWRRYLPVFTVFTLGLMAKSMLVTLPFLMLLLDLRPLRRFPRHPLQGRGPAAVGAAAEGIDDAQQRQGGERAGQPRGGLALAQGGHRERDEAEVQRLLVEVGKAVIGRHQPLARVLHLPGHLRVASLVGPEQREVAQAREQARPGDQERGERQQEAPHRHRSAAGPRARRAAANTAWNIGRVSRPVLVLRRLGW